MSSQGAEELLALGQAYDSGNGQQQNDAEAARYYMLAVEAGSVPAMRNLAGMYGSGRGVPEDQAKAKDLFQRAAEAGDAQAQYALANWYIEDRDEKVLWLRKAAAQGHEEARKLLLQLDAGESQQAAVNIWRGYATNPDGGRNCITAAKPTNEAPPATDHGDADFYVIATPKGNDEILVVSAVPLDKKHLHNVVVDGVVYPFAPVNDTELQIYARANSKEEAGNMWRIGNRAVVLAMLSGQRMIVSGNTKSGSPYADEYDLSGFKEAREALMATCTPGAK
jgi:TPR repeat protein